jgi:hypothetical protein
VLQINLALGWIWITIGFISGMVAGMFFHDANWLGGYATWRRRMVRLGHISFLGTGLLNLVFAFTVALSDDDSPPRLASWLFVAGALTMPTVCFLAAWKDAFRYLFVIPVASLIGAGTTLILQRLL